MQRGNSRRDARFGRSVAVAVALVIAQISAPQTARAQTEPPRDGGWRPSQAEVTMLPQYCWAQFTSFKGPEYHLPPGCGGGMNHYCPGLVEFNRAKRSYGDRDMRLYHLHRARRHTQYTVKAMERFPKCPLRPDVETLLRVIEIQWKGAGGK